MLTAKILLLYFLQSPNVIGLDVDTSNIDAAQAYCLAENIYYESRSENIKGQEAVASVTLNRTKDPRFPDTICGVIQQSSISKINNSRVCAFSWYCNNERHNQEIPIRNKDGKINEHVMDQFQTAVIVAIKILTGEITDNTYGATHFYNPYKSNPAWSHTLKKTVVIGNHIFLKSPFLREDRLIALRN